MFSARRKSTSHHIDDIYSLEVSDPTPNAVKTAEMQIFTLLPISRIIFHNFQLHSAKFRL